MPKESSELNMRRRTTLFVTLLICLIQYLPGRTDNPRTENVFIIVIDGIRNTDGFESGNRLMPFIWDSLRPRGTIYANFFNRGITVTNSGHSTIVSGVRQLLLNNSGIATPIRPREPTVGEYYRKAMGIPKEKVYYISGKNTIWRYPVSIYPGFGYEYSPTIELTSSADTATWSAARRIIDQNHPSLCYVLFAQVDAMGHTADSSKYYGSIRQVDWLIYLLWIKIQRDPIYHDRTTMIVTSDHGRHDDKHGGWQGHGDYCHGCRHIPLFAIGPDIKKNLVVTVPRDQIDIAPTVGCLLGFSTPLAQGTVLTEMLLTAPQNSVGWACADDAQLVENNLSRSYGLSRSCSIARNSDGLHVVYADNPGKEWKIHYTRSTDSGASWSAPQVVFQGTKGTFGANSEYTEPAIASVGEKGLFVVAEGCDPMLADTSYVWVLRGKRSTDSGLSWGNEIVIDTSTTVTCKPAITVSGDRINVISMKYRSVVSNLSRDGGKTFGAFQTVGSGGHPQSPAAAIVDTVCYVTWQNLAPSTSTFWNIWFDREPWRQVDTPMTGNGINSYSYEPSIAADKRGFLHVAYAQLADASAGNLWSIQHRRSLDLGKTWGVEKTIGQNKCSFSPVTKVSGNGKIYVVWSNYANNSWSIWGSYSPNNGLTWAEPYQITSSQTYSVEPDFAVKGDTLFVVWQDLRNGNWDIFFKEFVVSAVTDVGGREDLPVEHRLFQNYPNPFNLSTVISYQLSVVSSVTLDVYDVLGRRLRTLVDEEKPAGMYTVQFDASGLTSGVYYYRLGTGSFSHTRILVVLK